MASAMSQIVADRGGQRLRFGTIDVQTAFAQGEAGGLSRSVPSPADQEMSVAVRRKPWKGILWKTRALPLPPYDHTLVAATAVAAGNISRLSCRGIAMSWPCTRMSMSVSR